MVVALPAEGPLVEAKTARWPAASFTPVASKALAVLALDLLLLPWHHYNLSTTTTDNNNKLQKDQRVWLSSAREPLTKGSRGFSTTCSRDALGQLRVNGRERRSDPYQSTIEPHVPRSWINRCGARERASQTTFRQRTTQRDTTTKNNNRDKQI